MVFWAVSAALVVGMLIKVRLVMLMIPSSCKGTRWLTLLLGFPMAFVGITCFEYSVASLVESSASSEIIRPAMVLLAGLFASVSISLLVSLGMHEGSGYPPRDLGGVLIRLFPFSAIIGAIAFAVRYLTFLSLSLAFVGPVVMSVVSLGAAVWFFKTLCAMIKTDLPVSPPPRLSLPVAGSAGLVAMAIVGFAVILPKPVNNLDAVAVPSIMPPEHSISPDQIEERGGKLVVRSEELTLVVGKSPFEFAVVDRQNRVLLKLCTEKDYSREYQGVALNREFRAVHNFPFMEAGLLVKTRVRMSSLVMEDADELKIDTGEVIAEKRFGYRPLVVSFAFQDEDIIKITVDSGFRSPTRSTSIALYCGDKERFMGLGSGEGLIDYRGRDLDLVTEFGAARFSATGARITRHSRGRLNVDVAQGENTWPLPFVYMSRGAGLYMAEAVDPRIEIASRYPNAIRFSGRGGPLTLYLISGEGPVEVSEKFSRMMGERAALSTSALLPWLSLGWTRDLEAIGAEMEAIRRLGIPAEYVHIPWAGICDRQGDPACTGLPGLIDRGKAMGFRFSFHDQALISVEDEDYQEAVKNGYLVMNRIGLPYYFPSSTGSRVMIDFTNPAAVQWRAGNWKAIKDLGFSAVVLSPDILVPPDSVLYNGESGYVMRNLFPLVYASAVAEALGEETMIFSRLGFSGMEKFVAGVWPTLEYPGWSGEYAKLRLARVTGTSMSGSPIPFIGLPWTNSFSAKGELRLIESQGLGPYLFLPRKISAVERYQERGLGFLKDVKNIAEMQSRLFPYYYSLINNAESREPVMRPLAVLDPTRPNLYRVRDQYLVGGGLFVVPSGRLITKDRMVHFPPGRWLDLTDLSEHQEGEQSIATARPQTLLFLSQGQILPLFAEPFDTFSETSGLEARKGVMDGDMVLYWLFGPQANLTLFDGARASVRMAGESIQIRISGGPARDYSFRIFSCPPPVAVYLGGLRLPPSEWEYLSRSRVLTLSGLAGPEVEAEIVVKTAPPPE